MQRRCTTELRNAGAAYPRTCGICGLGPCRYYKESGKVAAAPLPEPVALKVYLAAVFALRSEMERVADRLKTHGFEITSRWVYDGESGWTQEQAAIYDLEDVDAADAVVSFTYPRGTLTSGGGRHVEFGYGLAKGKKLILIGARENVFHEFPGVELYPTLDAWLAAVARSKRSETV